MSDAFWTARPWEESDHAFIVDTWLSSVEPSTAGARARATPYLLEKNRELGGIVHDAHFVHLRPLVSEILSRVTVVVACMADEPSVVLGWCAAERHRTGCLVVHYVYVRPRYQRMGIGTALVEGALRDVAGEHVGEQVVVSAMTRPARKTVASRGWIHVPIEAFTRRENRRS